MRKVLLNYFMRRLLLKIESLVYVILTHLMFLIGRFLKNNLLIKASCFDISILALSSFFVRQLISWQLEMLCQARRKKNLSVLLLIGVVFSISVCIVVGIRFGENHHLFMDSKEGGF